METEERIIEPGTANFAELVQLGEVTEGSEDAPADIRPIIAMNVTYRPASIHHETFDTAYLLPMQIAAQMLAQLMLMRDTLCNDEQRDRFDSLAHATYQRFFNPPPANCAVCDQPLDDPDRPGACPCRGEGW